MQSSLNLFLSDTLTGRLTDTVLNVVGLVQYHNLTLQVDLHLWQVKPPITIWPFRLISICGKSNHSSQSDPSGWSPSVASQTTDHNQTLQVDLHLWQVKPLITIWPFRLISICGKSNHWSQSDPSGWSPSVASQTTHHNLTLQVDLHLWQVKPLITICPFRLISICGKSNHQSVNHRPPVCLITIVRILIIVKIIIQQAESQRQAKMGLGGGGVDETTADWNRSSWCRGTCTKTTWNMLKTTGAWNRSSWCRGTCTKTTWNMLKTTGDWNRSSWCWGTCTKTTWNMLKTTGGWRGFGVGARRVNDKCKRVYVWGWGDEGYGGGPWGWDSEAREEEKRGEEEGREWGLLTDHTTGLNAELNTPGRHYLMKVLSLTLSLMRGSTR